MVVAASSFAGPGKTIEREVTGRGEEPRQAIVNALIEGIQQVNGVHIDHNSVTSRKYADIVGDMKESFNASVVSSGEIHQASSGLVDGYEVLSQTQDAATKSWEVRLTVRVKTYDPMDKLLEGRRKVIAVLPFRAARETFAMFEANVPAGDVTRPLAQGMVVRFVQSRKFTVLDREFLKELLGEQEMLRSGEVPAEEQLRLGKRLGADYIVSGMVEDASSTAVHKVVKLTGREMTLTDARAAVAWRVIDVATGKVAWANTTRLSFSSADMRALSPEKSAMRIEDLLADTAAEAASEEITDNVFPIKIIKISGRDQIVLNQGGLRTKEGDELEIFMLGEMLVDPDTREILGREEATTGRLRVNRVEAKVSYASLIAGEFTQIKEGSVCRRRPLAKGQ